MTLQVIPLTDDGARLVTVDFIEGIGEYQFRTSFNSALNKWLVDILDSNGQVLVVGLSLLDRINIVSAYPHLTQLFQQIRMTAENRGVDTLGNVADVVQFLDSEVVASDTIPELNVTIDDIGAIAPPTPTFTVNIINITQGGVILNTQTFTQSTADQSIVLSRPLFGILATDIIGVEVVGDSSISEIIADPFLL